MARLGKVVSEILSGDSMSTVTDVRLLQFQKALLTMHVTLLGMVTEVRPLQPAKASVAIPTVPA